MILVICDVQTKDIFESEGQGRFTLDVKCPVHSNLRPLNCGQSAEVELESFNGANALTSLKFASQNQT